jgi:hypothetical protein
MSMWGTQIKNGISSEADLSQKLLVSAEFSQLALNSVK